MNKMPNSNYNAAIVPCRDYTSENVRAAINEALGAINGLDWVKPGMKVGIKPNIVAAKEPEHAVCTHPQMVYELVKMLVERGARVTVGESPGGFYNAAALAHHYSASGMTVVEEAGAKLNDNFATAVADFADGKAIKNFHYTAWLDDVDVLITFGKLKTHGMMGMTGAVKNLYGTVPGTVKLEYHYRFPKHEDFANMLVDVFEFSKPVLALIDAVVAMDGNGPTAGRPRQCGALIAAKSAYDADLVGAKVLGVEPMSVPVIEAAVNRGLSKSDISQISVYGDPEKFIIPDCNLIPRSDITSVGNTKGITRSLAQLFMVSKPGVENKQCVGCALCAKLCPAKAITMHRNKPRINRQVCIRCFCCQEFCPKGAMKVRRSFLAKLLSK